MVELGKIEKPDAESFSGKRKLYCVPNVLIVESAPEEYKKLANKYWDEVSGHIAKLEIAGKIKKIFADNITSMDKEAIDELVKINEKALQLIKSKIEEGAELFPLESEEIFGPFIDWRNCLHIIRTEEAAQKVLGFYMEFLNKRLEHILGVIEKNLLSDEAGLLIMADEYRAKLQFPSDIEIFLVTPPSYDDLMRWLRDRMKDLQQ